MSYASDALIDALQRKVKRLEADNAELRGYVQTLETANLDVTSRLQDYIGQYDPTDAFVIEVKAENTKLREYVNAIAIQSYKGKMFDCGYCPFFNQCYNDEPKEHQGRGCQWWLWARELGVEVDDA